MRRLAIALLLLALPACEDLFSNGAYHATAAPRAQIAFVAPDDAMYVEVWDTGGNLLTQVDAIDEVIDLGTAQDFDRLRLVARDGAGNVVARAIVPEAPRAADATDIGTMDAAASATAVLVEARATADGLTLDATPPPIVDEVARQAGGSLPELATLRTLVGQLPAGALSPLGADLDATYAAAHATQAAAYTAALAAAVAKIDVPIVCDPALIRVMFTVDASGQALDGNGAHQLIRQQPRAGKVFLGFAVADSSPIADGTGTVPQKIIPNDAQNAMFDDGTNGDEVAGDGIYTRVITLPRGMRIQYKYTDGAAGDGFTHTEEWPGNSRILEIDDVVTKNSDGRADCLIIRRDVFGDEASNKDFTSLAAGLRASGGALGWDVDLGGPQTTPLGDGRVIGGLDRLDPRSVAPLTPTGIAEARENGVCTRCPPPLVLAPGDDTPPTLLSAAFLSSTEIEVRFSEAMDFTAASDVGAYLVTDDTNRVLAVHSATVAGDRVRLGVQGPDLAETYALHVRQLPDASASHNLLDGNDTVTVGRDVTPPRPLAALAGSRKDLDPAAVLDDPTVGEVVALSFSEELDPRTAEDIAHYHIEDVFGEPLDVLGAYLVGLDRVLLVTAPQEKQRQYTVTVENVTDLSGNPSPAADPLPFAGFALYKMHFAVVPGFAFATRDGSKRGVPGGERLYVTGTPLAVARDPHDGTDISLAGRTDVTGVPQFELLQTSDSYMGKPIFAADVLVPPGVYAWKAAHGVPGEWTNPPRTLVKVTKSLGTTNDATGVNVDPVTLIARNGVAYPGAVLSLDGTDAPGPTVLFKRENPDETCAVIAADVDCATIVIGTWRDLDEFVAGGVLEDYDDGEPEVAPTLLGADVTPPQPIYVQVRDSESLLIAFDEGLAAGATVTVTATRADGAPLALVQTKPRFPLPHELAIQTVVQMPGAAYTLSISGIADAAGNVSATPLSIGWTSPATTVPFIPFEDHDPPVLIGATADSPTSVRVRFDETLSSQAASASKYAIRASGGGAAPSVNSAVLASNGKEVVLTTSAQTPMAAYTVTVTGIADIANPPNTLASGQTDFVGFGDTTPPALSSAQAIGPGDVVLVFSKSLDEESAAASASYGVSGASVTSVEFAGDPALHASAFNQVDAPTVRNIVLLHTTLTAGMTATVTATVKDLSGNTGGGSMSVTGVATPPTVDVAIEYVISDSATVAGRVPPRALSVARLLAEREGVFLVGVGGFPPEGAPLDGVEPELVDDGTQGDAVAGDGVYTLLIKDVPLGSMIEWKAFASYTVAWKAAHPQDAAAQFADALPGPAAFSDGQEYPGNEAGARILGDGGGTGTIHLRNLFGDETTYKKLSMSPAFIWVASGFTYAP